MDCPICKSQLNYGTVQIHGTVTSFFFFGLSYQPMFYRQSNGEEEKIFNPNMDYSVLRCDKCRTIVIPDLETVLPKLNGKCQRCGKSESSGKPYCHICRQHVE